MVIPTHNRKEDVSKAIASCLRQTARPEVIVLDDASTDGTAADVRKRYPGIRLVAASVRQGPARLENLGISMARAEIVFQLDDDAEFMSEDTVAQTLRLFDDRRVAVVGIPYVEPTVHNRVLQRAPDDSSVWVAATFVSCACALRKSVFTAVGGYRLTVDGQGEEADLAIRMLDAGYVIRLGTGGHVNHYRSPLRSVTRMAIQGRKNEVLYAWYNVPSLFLLAHLAYRILQGHTDGNGYGRKCGDDPRPRPRVQAAGGGGVPRTLARQHADLLSGSQASPGWPRANAGYRDRFDGSAGAAGLGGSARRCPPTAPSPTPW